MGIEVVSCVKEEPGLSIMFEELYMMGRHDSYRKREAAMILIKSLCNEPSPNLVEHLSQLIIFVTEAMSDDNEGVCLTACASLESLVSKVTIMICIDHGDVIDDVIASL